MNTHQLHTNRKNRGSADVTYLGHAVDEMIWNFMQENEIPGLTLAIVQAPYIPRVVGYGMSDPKQKRLASPNTMWPAGPISQAFAAVALMQLYELNRLKLDDRIGTIISGLPAAWNDITLLMLLRHASGIPDYRFAKDWKHNQSYTFSELTSMVSNEPLAFVPDTGVEQSATNFLLITEVVERISGQSYHDFVKEHQIDFLHLRHTAFAEDLNPDHFFTEDVSRTDNVHQLFKADGRYIDPIEPAQSYTADGSPVPRADSSALRGFSDIWASAQDISF